MTTDATSEIASTQSKEDSNKKTIATTPSDSDRIQFNLFLNQLISWVKEQLTGSKITEIARPRNWNIQSYSMHLIYTLSQVEAQIPLEARSQTSIDNYINNMRRFLGLLRGAYSDYADLPGKYILSAIEMHIKAILSIVPHLPKELTLVEEEAYKKIESTAPEQMLKIVAEKLGIPFVLAPSAPLDSKDFKVSRTTRDKRIADFIQKEFIPLVSAITAELKPRMISKKASATFYQMRELLNSVNKMLEAGSGVNEINLIPFSLAAKEFFDSATTSSSTILQLIQRGRRVYEDFQYLKYEDAPFISAPRFDQKQLRVEKPTELPQTQTAVSDLLNKYLVKCANDLENVVRALGSEISPSESFADSFLVMMLETKSTVEHIREAQKINNADKKKIINFVVEMDATLKQAPFPEKFKNLLYPAFNRFKDNYTMAGILDKKPESDAKIAEISQFTTEEKDKKDSHTGTPKDSKNIEEFYKLAAEREYKPCLADMADFYMETAKTAPPSDIKIPWDLGQRLYQLLVADYEKIITNQAIEKSETLLNDAFALFYSAAKYNNANAQHLIAEFFYANPTSPKKDIGKAFEYYQLAANQKISAAQFRLAELHEMYPQLCPPALKKQPQQIFDLYLQAAEGGDAEAQYIVAGRYLDGAQGVEKDIAKAIRFCELVVKSAEYNIIASQIPVLNFLVNYYTSKEDYANAIRCYDRLLTHKNITPQQKQYISDKKAALLLRKAGIFQEPTKPESDEAKPQVNPQDKPPGSNPALR